MQHKACCPRAALTILIYLLRFTCYIPFSLFQNMRSIICPFCSASFKNKSSLNRHLAQPTSRCRRSRNQHGFKENTEYYRHRSILPPSLRLFSKSPSPDDVLSKLDRPASNGPTSPTSSSNRMEEDLPAKRSSLVQDYFGRFIEAHPDQPATFGSGNTFMDGFHNSQHAKERAEAPYYPFKSKDEWEHARFLLNSSLSQAEVSEYLELGHVSFILLLSLVTKRFLTP